MENFTQFELCDSEFWDPLQSWHTNCPRLSTCFRNTVLVWLPAYILLGAIINHLIFTRKKDAKRKVVSINWNAFNIFRLIITCTLHLIVFSESIKHISSLTLSANNRSSSKDTKLIISTLLAPIIQAISYLCLLILNCSQRKIGRFTSAWIWFYLLTLLIAETLDLHSRLSGFQASIVDLVKFAIILLLFVLECIGDTPPPTLRDSSKVEELDTTDSRVESPVLRASFCSKILFSWYTSFLWFGFKNRLTTSDLWKISGNFRVDKQAIRFQETWIRQTKRESAHQLHWIRRTKRESAIQLHHVIVAKQSTAIYQTESGGTQAKNGIFYVLYRLLGWRLATAAGLKLVFEILQYFTLFVLKNLLRFISSPSSNAYGQMEPEWHGLFYCVLLFIIPTIRSIFWANYLVGIDTIALEVRGMIISSVYRKSMQLSSNSRLQSTSGEIINLMSVDSDRFYELILNINRIWSAPFQIIVTLVLLYGELGWSVLAGLAFMVLFIPINLYLSRSTKTAHSGMMKTKDNRIKQMNELLSGIKVVKLYAWENSFLATLFGFRNTELKYLDRILFLNAMQSFSFQCLPFLVSLMTFAVYVLSDEANVLTPEKAFVSIALFNLLKYPLLFLPTLFTALVTAMVSAKRLNRFLNNDELVRYVTRNEHPDDAITIESGTLSWFKEEGEEEEKPESEKEESRTTDKNAVLRDINIHIKRNSFVAIVGQVASGKSSLLSAMLGEMHRISGRFNICKSMNVAYLPQQAWIQNMTVRDNILFGSAFDEEKYRKTLSVCALEADLAIIPGGDQAEIGEKGINLSGGQKQRVSLARACYSNSDLFLLDDPLSALDSHVARHVFNEMLSSTTGVLKNKTRVLATNSLFVLPYVDHIIVLDKGRIVQSGTYRELTSKHQGYLKEIMIKYSGSDNQSELNDENMDTEMSEIKSCLATEKISPESRKFDLIQVGKLVEIERAETGSVDYRVYWAYMKAFSKSLMLITIITAAASAGFNIMTNIWLAIWTSDSKLEGKLDCRNNDADECNTSSLRLMRLSVFAALGAIQCLVVLICTLVLSNGAIKASRTLHYELLTKILHSPMSFFDTTPIGRIVNRFAKDIDVIDITLPSTFRCWLNCLMPLLGTIILICNTFPSLLFILLPLIVIVSLIQRVFIVTTRQLKRLESTTRSPINSHFNETLSGMSTIRAYNSITRFIHLSDNLVDKNQSCSYPNVVALRWLAIRLEFLANLITMCVALLSVYYRDIVGAGVAGLMISYTMNINGALAWLLKMSSDLETNIVSVERILEYVENKQEDSWIKNERPSSDWPNNGAIEIKGYSTRYREETDLVLRDISIDIKPCEKIGIVGRTGSGKSSLSLSLFRILEPASGRIMIDQLDIVKYGLHDIRSKLTIIPQDPVLFSGTLRFNLDPLQLYSDFEIWRALESAHLKRHISSLKLGLDYELTEYGENFSVGQRQLICLARAILRKSKILILDEATASVDLETDLTVQTTIRDIFNDCTIITIAHRLHTILDSDRILVLEKGYVRELDSPENLIRNPESAFFSLVKDAGIETSNVFKMAAARRTRV